MLRSFIAVATYKNFSQAARELNTVQPAISRHISELEDELGVELFWRNKREVRITAAGQSLLKDAKSMIELELLAIDSARRTALGEMGSIRIGHIGSATFSFLPNVINRYTSLYPGVKISLFEMSVQEQLKAFNEEKIDVGISRTLPRVIGKKIRAEELYREDFNIVLPSSHRFSRENKLPLERLSDDPFILFSRNEAPIVFDKIISQCLTKNFTPRVTSEPSTMQTVITEVASGLGVSIVPGCIKNLYTKGCVFIEIDNPTQSLSTEIHYTEEPLFPTVKAFVEMTLGFFRNEKT